MEQLRTEVNQLLAELARSLGLPSITLDEHNRCVLLFDEKLMINIEFSEEQQSLMVYSYLCENPLEARELVLEKLLEANFDLYASVRACFSLEKQSQSLFLTQSWSLPLKSPEVFEEELASFVETVETWQTKIQQIVSETEDRLELET